MSHSSAAPSEGDPARFHQFVLKIASRCNLRCTYCYMYASHDQSWRRQPVLMTDDTVDAFTGQLAAHVERHGLRRVKVVLHGGEPLVAGPEYLRRVVSRIGAGTPADLRVEWQVQTNGVLLDGPWLRMLAELGIRVGVSLDGNRAQHDRRRRDGSGRGTHDRVAHGLRLLMRPEFVHIYGGLLTVVDLESDPVEVYESLLAFAPPQVDFLLPHANWATPPPGLAAGTTPYGDWLTAAFDRWFHVAREETVVRLFQDTVLLLLGGQATTTHLGSAPAGFVVVNTDGSFEQDDGLRTTGPDGSTTGLSVFTDSLEDVAAHPGMSARRLHRRALATQCRTCSLVKVCGGGNYVHRYRPDTGLNNPSVYCADLQKYIRHVNAAVRAALV